MPYPFLLWAIRAFGRQYEIARIAGMREGRLSEIVRRGGAKPEERAALSRALGRPERELFHELQPFAAQSEKRQDRDASKAPELAAQV